MREAHIAEATAAKGKTPRCTVAICTYRRYALLAEAIDSVLEDRDASNDPDCRIMVVDNSPDAAEAHAFADTYTRSETAGLAFTHLGTPGLANARNFALTHCDTEILAFIDDDARVRPGWIDAMLEGFDRFGPGTAVVGGRVVPRWGVPRPSWLHDDMLVSLSLVDWGGDLRLAGLDEWFAGTNIAFRTHHLRGAALFRTDLGRSGGHTLLGNEEIDVMRSLHAAGLRPVYQPRAEVEHLIPASRLTQSWFRRRYVWQAVSDALMSPELLARERDHGLNRVPEAARRALLDNADTTVGFRDRILGLHFLVRVALAPEDE